MKIIIHGFSEEQLAAARAIAPDADFVSPATDEELQREIEGHGRYFWWGNARTSSAVQKNSVGFKPEVLVLKGLDFPS